MPSLLISAAFRSVRSSFSRSRLSLSILLNRPLAPKTSLFIMSVAAPMLSSAGSQRGRSSPRNLFRCAICASDAGRRRHGCPRSTSARVKLQLAKCGRRLG